MTLLLGPPPDAVAWVAVSVAGFVLLAGHRTLTPLLLRAPRGVVLAALAGTAVALSVGYFLVYLRGGPRIIDATSYWLQARALSRGQVTWDLAEPSASQRGRFLLLSGAEGAHHLGVIFPPGYPALLALGFLVGAAQWVGPVLGGALVLATYALARRVAPEREEVARLAACLSVLSATLRYHCADTMSHGWAALLLAASLTLTLPVSTERRLGLLGAALGGLAYGWLFATRPITALAVSPLIGLGLVRMRMTSRAALALAACVPIGLFVLEQRAATGHLLSSSQSAYYATSDGPPGCFRLGLGPGIGCLHEHGEYVRALGGDGYGLRAMLVVTLRRLWMHLMDFANAEPLALLPLVGIWCWRRQRQTLWMAAAIPLVVLAYALFYFDGSYPGGGARLLADLLPIEHVLGALGIVSIAHRLAKPAAAPAAAPAPAPPPQDAAKPPASTSVLACGKPALARATQSLGAQRVQHLHLPRLLQVLEALAPAWLALRQRLRRTFAASSVSRVSAWVVALSLGGFGLRASYVHLRLRDREGGRPYYEPTIVAKAKVDHGLLLTQTDSAFNLAFDPGAQDPSREWVVIRERGDDRDRLVWEKLGQPPAYRYVFGGRQDEQPSVVPWAPPPFHPPYRYEAEAEWPPLEQLRGHLEPMYATGTCAWGGQVLTARPQPGSSMYARISVPVPFTGRFRVGVHVASKGKVLARLALVPGEHRPPLATWPYSANFSSFTCATLMVIEANLSGPAVALEMQVQGHEFSLDAIALDPVPPAAPATPQP